MKLRASDPYCIGDDAKQSAIDYAKARAKFGHGEIRVLNHDWNVVEIIAAENTRGLV